MPDPGDASRESSRQLPSGGVVRPYPLPELRTGEFYVEPVDPKSLLEPAVYCMEVDDRFDYYAYRAKSIVYTGRTPFQDVLIVDTYNYGRTLFLDSVVQSSAEDEALYHEMLVQPPMLIHPRPRDVLIIGGGEGATLREVLAHGSVRSATMVDIDREAVELCRDLLPSWNRGAFDDSRARLVFDDGRKFVEESDDFYDVAIIDVVDMIEDSPAFNLYTREFYQALRRRLRPDAIVMIQGLEFSFSDYKQHVSLVRTLRTLFSQVHSAHLAVPSFLGSWGLIMASDWATPGNCHADMIDGLVRQRLGDNWLDHLNGEFLMASFAHCKETRYLLGQPGPILEDGVRYVPPPDVEDVEPTRERLPVFDE
jgi:spermidine synthase